MTPEFRSAWAKTWELHDIDYVLKDKQDAQEKLIKESIERSAQYAILSHTWIRDTPGDIVYGNWGQHELYPRGCAKVTKFCEVAAQNHGMTLGWIDTLCINKESSAELDESILSMYKWYRSASVCVTYLSETQQITYECFDSWFTRGWTLQELLAPALSCFYNADWEVLGSSNVSIIKLFINKAIGITEVELDLFQSGDIEKILLSCRMQLASMCQVTREEDASYSLMGVLGVDIPISYGEGSKHSFFHLFWELLNTKKHVLDLFNHAYDFSNTLIPSSVQLYSNRSTYFDTFGGQTGTSLDCFLPMEPILLTHLGVRIPLLLAPGLLEAASSSDQQFTPYGDFYAKNYFTIDKKYSIGDHSYNILDQRIYTQDLATLLVPNGAVRERIIQTFGIFNFGVENGNILIPSGCICAFLYFPGAKPGEVTSSNIVQIIPATPTPVFHLKSAQNNYIIPQNEIGKHGLQLLTLYL